MNRWPGGGCRRELALLRSCTAAAKGGDDLTSIMSSSPQQPQRLVWQGTLPARVVGAPRCSPTFCRGAISSRGFSAAGGDSDGEKSAGESGASEALGGGAAGDSSEERDDTGGKATLERDVKAAIQSLSLLRHCRPNLAGTGTFFNTFIRPVIKWGLAGMISKTLRTIDPEHDDEEFLEAVGDAYCMVNYLLSTGDLETLRPMMTDQLHRSFCETAEKIDELGFNVKIDVEEITAVEMSDMCIDSKEAMLRVRPTMAATLPDATAAEAEKATLAAWQEKKEARKARAAMSADNPTESDAEAGKVETEPDTAEESEVMEKLWAVFSLQVTTREQWIFTSKDDPSFVKKKTLNNCVSLWRFARGPLEVNKRGGGADRALKEATIQQIQKQIDEKPWVLLSTFW